jgi:hypothetical protein
VAALAAGNERGALIGRLIGDALCMHAARHRTSPTIAVPVSSVLFVVVVLQCGTRLNGTAPAEEFISYMHVYGV